MREPNRRRGGDIPDDFDVEAEAEASAMPRMTFTTPRGARDSDATPVPRRRPGCAFRDAFARD